MGGGGRMAQTSLAGSFRHETSYFCRKCDRMILRVASSRFSDRVRLKYNNSRFDGHTVRLPLDLGLLSRAKGVELGKQLVSRRFPDISHSLFVFSG